MSIYNIAKKLHCILNQTDEITSKNLDATISIGNVALIECDENASDNIYIYLSEILADCFDTLFPGKSSYDKACKDTEEFLNGLRDKDGNLIYWCFPNASMIFVKLVEDGYISKEIDDNVYIVSTFLIKEGMEEYTKWRIAQNEI